MESGSYSVLDTPLSRSMKVGVGAAPCAASGERAPLLRRIGGGRRRGGGWRGRGLPGGGPLFDDAHGDDRALIERQQRYRERGLAEHIRRRQYGGDDEGDHDEIAAFLAQLL